MPWQAAPSLIIIIGAFNVAAGLVWSVDRLYYGKVCMCVYRKKVFVIIDVYFPFDVYWTKTYTNDKVCVETSQHIMG